MNTILLLILILLLIGGVPAWRGGVLTLNSALGIVLLVVLIVVLFGLVAPYPAARWHYYWP